MEQRDGGHESYPIKKEKSFSKVSSFPGERKNPMCPKRGGKRKGNHKRGNDKIVLAKMEHKASNAGGWSFGGGPILIKKDQPQELA